MLRFDEASVGTEVNSHTDDLNTMFVHLSREFPDVTSKSRRNIGHAKLENFESSIDISTSTLHD